MHDDESSILDLMKARVAALMDRDARRAVETLAPDVVSFELAGELQTSASQATDVHAFQGWLDSWEHLEVEVAGAQIRVSGSVGFCHSVNRLSGVRAGRRIDIWMRSTLGFERRDDGWKIVHAHTSVPISTDGMFRAAVDLKP